MNKKCLINKKDNNKTEDKVDNKVYLKWSSLE